MTQASKFSIENEMELQLFSSMEPVAPDPMFVKRLRTRLELKPAIVVEAHTFMGAYLIVAGGLFFGVLLVWILRTIFKGIRE